MARLAVPSSPHPTLHRHPHHHLPRSFTISNFRWYHDLSLAIFSEVCVFSNGRGVDINIDSHRGGGWPGQLRQAALRGRAAAVPF